MVLGTTFLCSGKLQSFIKVGSNQNQARVPGHLVLAILKLLQVSFLFKYYNLALPFKV
jgi:hypothetical protein